MDYKTICIIGYILSAIGAIVTSSIKLGWINIVIPEEVYYAYFIGGVITLYCAHNWLFGKEKL